MDFIKYLSKIQKYFFDMMNLISACRYIFEYSKYKKYIYRNKELKDCNKGKTCFVLGNGPSLKSVNIKALKGEDIFTVNKMVNTTLFDELKPKFHCVIDRYVYQDIRLELRDKMNSETKFIFHRMAIEDIKNYANAYITYNTHICNSTKIKYDLTQNADNFMNVVPYCIMCAIYMGYKKIVLLGCDFSFFAARKDNHFYSLGEDTERKETLYQDLVGSAIALQQFEYVYKFAKLNDIEIVNATEGSLLDVIPQVQLSKCLNKKSKQSSRLNL